MATAARSAVLVLHEKIVRDDDAIVELVIWRLPRATPERPHALKYRLYFGRGGKCLVRYDNETGKGDHRHVRGKETPYRFVSLAKLRRDFEADVRSTEVKMKKVRKIQVSVGSVEDALDRFEHAWRQAEKGRVRAAQVRLSFESLPTLLKNLTPARWTLLEQLKRDGPLSINELARRLARHYKNVHTDVTRLAELGLIERRSDQRVEVVWDIVAAEMRLAA